MLQIGCSLQSRVRSFDKMHLKTAFLSISRFRYVKETSIQYAVSIDFSSFHKKHYQSRHHSMRRLRIQLNLVTTFSMHLIAHLLCAYLFGTSYGSKTRFFDYLYVAYHIMFFNRCAYNYCCCCGCVLFRPMISIYYSVLLFCLRRRSVNESYAMLEIPICISLFCFRFLFHCKICNEH